MDLVNVEVMGLKGTVFDVPIFDRADVDLVLIPVAGIGKLRWLGRIGLHRKPGWTQRRMQDVAEVIRPGSR